MLVLQFRTGLGCMTQMADRGLALAIYGRHAKRAHAQDIKLARVTRLRHAIAVCSTCESSDAVTLGLQACVWLARITSRLGAIAANRDLQSPHTLQSTAPPSRPFTVLDPAPSRSFDRVYGLAPACLPLVLAVVHLLLAKHPLQLQLLVLFCC